MTAAGELTPGDGVAAMATAKVCRHCGKGKANRPRGLCWTCYGKVRHLYPVSAKFRPDLTPDGDEMTEAELDALIERQRANLPRWWVKAEPAGGVMDPRGVDA